MYITHTHERKRGREGIQTEREREGKREEKKQGKAGEERREIGGTERVLVGIGVCSYPCLSEASGHLSESKVDVHRCTWCTHKKSNGTQPAGWKGLKKE